MNQSKIDVNLDISEVEVFLRKSQNDIVFDFNNLKYAKGDSFLKDFNLIAKYVKEYNGRGIFNYVIEKKGRNDRTYLTSRLPKADKQIILRRLKQMMEIKEEKISTMKCEYFIISVNHDAIAEEKEKATHTK